MMKHLRDRLSGKTSAQRSLAAVTYATCGLSGRRSHSCPCGGWPLRTSAGANSLNRFLIKLSLLSGHRIDMEDALHHREYGKHRQAPSHHRGQSNP